MNFLGISLGNSITTIVVFFIYHNKELYNHWDILCMCISWYEMMIWHNKYGLSFLLRYDREISEISKIMGKHFQNSISGGVWGWWWIPAYQWIAHTTHYIHAYIWLHCLCATSQHIKKLIKNALLTCKIHIKNPSVAKQWNLDWIPWIFTLLPMTHHYHTLNNYYQLVWIFKLRKNKMC